MSRRPIKILPVLLALLAIASCGPTGAPPDNQELLLMVEAQKRKGVRVSWNRITRDGVDVAYRVHRWAGGQRLKSHLTSPGTLSFVDSLKPFPGGVSRKYQVAVFDQTTSLDGLKSEPAVYDGLADLDGDGVTKGDCDDLDLAVKPGASEVCNGKDDDCDGKVDEEVCGECKPGSTRKCYQGPPASREVGECKEGEQTCSPGVSVHPV